MKIKIILDTLWKLTRIAAIFTGKKELENKMDRVEEKFK